MERIFWAGVGGFIGSALRYGLGGWLARMKGGATFPWETLVINVAGCLAIGVLAALAETRGLFTGTTRVFVFVGILGGFTTFSTFGYETFQLLRDGQHAAAAASAALQFVLGIGAVWAGNTLVRAVWG
jgi:fluoride exporter